MRTDRAWAIARADGSVDSGLLPRVPFARVPFIRVLAGLGPALALGLRGRRGNEGLRRPAPWPLIVGLVMSELAAVCANALLARAHVPHAWSPVAAIAIVLVAIVVFRVTTPAAQWRYHGAEHKAVAAHEHGTDLDDINSVLRCSRVHPRCGTHLIVWLSLVGLSVARLPLLAQLLAMAAGIAAIAEVMSIAARHPRAGWSRVVQAPGHVLQRVITTSEPSPAEQLVGCRALVTCLARHRAAVGEAAYAA